MPRRKRNPAWDVAIAIGAIAIGAIAVVAGTLGVAYRALAKSFSELEPSLEPEIDLDTAMPSSTDLPMGWTIEEAGTYENNQDPNSSAPGYRFEWRILRLHTPSTMCTPPCSYVAVWSGTNTYEQRTSGWVPTYSPDGAIELLATKHDEVG